MIEKTYYENAEINVFTDGFNANTLASYLPKIYIEAGWLNKSSWHPSPNRSTASRIGKNIGANHQIGKLIAEKCERLKIPHELVKPTKSKVTDHKLFCRITGYKGRRSNQEMRDAAMLIWGRKKIK